MAVSKEQLKKDLETMKKIFERTIEGTIQHEFYKAKIKDLEKKLDE